MYVSINFTYNNLKHLIRREITIKNHNKKYIFPDDSEVFLSIINNDATEERKENDLEVQQYINNILNDSVKNYFFFDGAKIENFTKEDHNKDVELAIKNVLKIEAIIRSKEHIEVIISEIRNSIKSFDKNKELEKINDDIEKLKENLKKNESDLLNINKEIHNAEKIINNTEKEIHHNEQNSEYKEQKNELLKHKEIKSEKNNEYEKKLDSFLEKSYILFIDNLITDVNVYLEKKIKNIKIPSSFIKDIIKKTIEDNKCYICEENIDDNKKILLNNKIIDVSFDSENYNTYNDLIHNLKILEKEKTNLYKDIIDIKNNIKDYDTEINSINEKINLIDKKIIKEMPDIGEHKNILETYKNKKDKKIEEKGIIQKTIEDINKDIKVQENRFSEISKTIEKCKIDQKKLDLSLSIKNEIDKIFEIYEKEEIIKINEQIKIIFDKIIRKKDVFKEIFVDENYKLNIYREYKKENILNELSYGERQILSLSLIFALANVSGDIGPFIIDTPMGNLDPIHRQKLLKNITNFVNQLILLVTSSEFTDDLYDISHNQISGIFNLENINKGITIINKEKN